MSKHHDILGVQPGCGVASLKAHWRALASEHHPDRGGNSIEFTTYRGAYTAALGLETALEAQCPECHGKGKVLLGKGFTKMPMVCPKCKGLKFVKETSHEV